MSWTLSVIGVAALVTSVVIVRRMKRLRDQRETEQHSITAEELHALLASNQEVLRFDVCQPLDLLAYPEIIPKAQRVAPNEVLERPSLIPKEKDAVVYCTCPSDKTSRTVLRRALALQFFREVPQGWIGGLEGEGISGRAQKRRINWTRTLVLATRWLPQPRALHPFPDARFAATHPR